MAHRAHCRAQLGPAGPPRAGGRRRALGATDSPMVIPSAPIATRPSCANSAPAAWTGAASLGCARAPREPNCDASTPQRHVDFVRQRSAAGDGLSRWRRHARLARLLRGGRRRGRRHAGRRRSADRRQGATAPSFRSPDCITRRAMRRRASASSTTAVCCRNAARRAASERIAYVDIDVHHGDGVFYGFESDPDLIFADIHEDGRFLYPGTGRAEEMRPRRSGRAPSSTFRCRRAATMRCSREHWPRVLAHLGSTEPEFILLQCGADSVEGDPITHLQLSADSHAHGGARSLAQLADRSATAGCWRWAAAATTGSTSPRPGMPWSRRCCSPEQMPLSGTICAPFRPRHSYPCFRLDDHRRFRPRSWRARSPRKNASAGRSHRADRLGKLRQPARARGAGLGAHQQVRRRLSGQALLRRLRVRRRRRARSPSTAPRSCSAPTTPTCSRIRARQANAAAYLALINPGDTILGMSLDHGGHLTHGAKVNFSGKHLPRRAVRHLRADDGEIDYDAAGALALAEKPKMIIAGFSAYSRQLDFARFREIADSGRRLSGRRHGACRRPRGRGPVSESRCRSPTWSPPPRTRRCAVRAAA